MDYNIFQSKFCLQSDVANLRLSTMGIERVCSVVRAALGAGAASACEALQAHKVSGLALSICRLADLKPVRGREKCRYLFFFY